MNAPEQPPPTLEGMGSPPTVIVYRNEPMHAGAAFPMGSERYTVDVPVETAPMPPASTTFYGTGRDPEHTGRRMWRFMSLAIPEWLSVADWPFKIAKVPSALVVSMPRGGQNPLRERTNIISPPQTTLGDLTANEGVESWSPHLAKITY